MQLKALLNTHSMFSFGKGVSSPKTLVERAALLGYKALCLTDDDGVYGAVELYKTASAYGLTPLIGATFTLDYDGETYPLILIASSRESYQVLNELSTIVHSQENRKLTLPILESHTEGLHCLTGGRFGFPSQLLAKRKISEATKLLLSLRTLFPNKLWLQLYFDKYPDDTRRMRILRSFAVEYKVATLAAPEIRYAHASQFKLYDAVVCARLGISVETPHKERPRNDCQSLRAASSYNFLFPEAIENANRLVEQCYFDLLPERLELPPARVPKGYAPDNYLEERCYESLSEKYSGELFSQAKARLEQELTTLKALGLHNFFLVASEITDYCKSRGILAAGRGSAAASVVAYLLGITSIDPIKYDLLFERFLHTGRTAMPDIDIDISSSRRREVIAWVEESYGEKTQAMVCNRITYYLPSAIQDIGRALGLPPHLRNKLSKSLGRDFKRLRPNQAKLASIIFDEVLGDAPVKEVLYELFEEMERGMVRHIAPHSGGMLLAAKALTNYSGLERSSGGIKMIQFDKDDAEDLGLIKLDLLGLRMLGAIERARELICKMDGHWLDTTQLPNEPAIWNSIGKGDTMALFQLESPAQANISASLKAKNLKDLAHQIALIRPGPIQSGTVHPYINRHLGREQVTYLHPSLEPILKKTYGVLLFQDDVLRISHHVAGMSWSEAERLRKKISKYEDLSDLYQDKLSFIEGAIKTVGASEDEATAIFDMMANFKGYGFAESHAWAFAQHAYVSAYLRYAYPAEYLAAFMTESPGMWSHQTLRQEARALDVGFARLDINTSSMSYLPEWREDKTGKRLRPPLTAVKAVSTDAAQLVLLERLHRGCFYSVSDFYQRIKVNLDALEALVRAGAFDRLHSRRDALFELEALKNTQAMGEQPLFSGIPKVPSFAKMPIGQRLQWDIALKGYSELEVHPLDLIRQQLYDLGVTPLGLLQKRFGFQRTAGMVVSKQRPPTAAGFAFYVVEDGPVRIQLVIPPNVWESHREVLRDAKVLVADGEIQKHDGVVSLKVGGLGLVL